MWLNTSKDHMAKCTKIFVQNYKKNFHKPIDKSEMIVYNIITGVRDTLKINSFRGFNYEQHGQQNQDSAGDAATGRLQHQALQERYCIRFRRAFHQ